MEGFALANTTLAAWFQLDQIVAMHTQIETTKRLKMLPTAFLSQKAGRGSRFRSGDLHNTLKLPQKNAASGGIRTRDQSLGKQPNFSKGTLE